MALATTHIRFALDLKNKYEVFDLGKYLSGTIYPDSRYLTGIDRNLTHFNELLDKNFWKDDFCKGWSAHFLCDKVQNKLMREKFSFFYEEKNGENVWIDISAVKVAHDLLVAGEFDVAPYLRYLDYIFNPNGEDTEKLKLYNRLIKKSCGEKKATVESACGVWLELGVDRSSVERIETSAKKIMTDSSLMASLKNLYKEMLVVAGTV